MNRPSKDDYINFNGKEYTSNFDRISYCHELEKYCDELEAKEEKYRWHDLRENPNDLPRQEVVNICFETKLGYMYSSAIHSGINWLLEGADAFIFSPNDVIKWKYIKRVEDEI